MNKTWNDSSNRWEDFWPIRALLSNTFRVKPLLLQGRATNNFQWNKATLSESHTKQTALYMCVCMCVHTHKHIHFRTYQGQHVVEGNSRAIPVKVSDQGLLGRGMANLCHVPVIIPPARQDQLSSRNAKLVSTCTARQRQEEPQNEVRKIPGLTQNWLTGG